jgi:hypothetical protein
MAINNYKHNLNEPLQLRDVNISGNVRLSGIFSGSVSAPNGFIGNITGNVTGNITNTVTGINSTEIVRGNMADNDQFRILIGGTASDAGFVEIATADGGNEPIHIRQYTGTFTTLTRTLTLLDGSGNTSIPGTLTVTSNLTVSGGTITAGNVAATLLGGNTTTNIAMAGGLTSGTLTFGGTAQTGTITLGQATVSQTTNIQAGVSAAGTSKTINFGTGGAAGSFTQINVGPTAGLGTVVINSGTNLFVGSATSTGTASQRLQVTGGAYVSGSVGIGTTNPLAKLDVRGGDVIVGVNTSNGVILTSPNGTKYRLIVDDVGVLSTVLVP